MFSRTILRTPLRKVVQVKRNMGGHSGEVSCNITKITAIIYTFIITAMNITTAIIINAFYYN